MKDYPRETEKILSPSRPGNRSNMNFSRRFAPPEKKSTPVGCCPHSLASPGDASECKRVAQFTDHDNDYSRHLRYFDYQASPESVSAYCG